MTTEVFWFGFGYDSAPLFVAQVLTMLAAYTNRLITAHKNRPGDAVRDIVPLRVADRERSRTASPGIAHYFPCLP